MIRNFVFLFSNEISPTKNSRKNVKNVTNMENKFVPKFEKKVKNSSETNDHPCLLLNLTLNEKLKWKKCK